MIVEKGTLTGKINEKQSLAGTINKSTEIIFPETQEKQVTPTKQVQEIVPDSGIYALSKVTVNPIPNDYIIPNLQSKSITITENGTQTITADSGYDGLSSVGVEVNVNSGDEATIKYNTESYGSFTDLANRITEVKDLDISEFTSLSGLFEDWHALQKVTFKKLPNNPTSYERMFYSCSSLEDISDLDTSKATSLANTFYLCSSLQVVPVLDTTNLSGAFAFRNTFAMCPLLTETSLNNILQICIDVSNKINANYKTLKSIGLSSAQATTCTGLSNYQAFLAAGWTTGY